MTIARGAVAALLLICAAAPQVSAQPVDDDPIALAIAELDQGKDAQALVRLDKALQKARTPEAVAAVQPFRAAALASLKRDAEAVTAIKAAYQAAPGADFPARYALFIGNVLGSYDLATAGADRLLSNFPGSVRNLTGLDVWKFFRIVRARKGTTAADDYYVGFAAAGIGAADPVAHDEIAYLAAAIHLKRGEASRARQLIERIEDALVLSRVLTERRFEPVWASTEVRVEPAMAKATRAAVARAETVFAADSTSVAARSALIQAYAMAGRLAEAEGVGAAFAPTPEEIAKIEQSGGWLIDRHAGVLRALGRDDAADARYAALRALRIEENPWLINMIINRVGVLVYDGSYAKAAPLLDEAELLAKTYGSPYARQLLRRHRVCLLAGTKQPVEPVLTAFRDHAVDSKMVTVEGLQCVGKTDEAAAIVVAELADPDNAVDLTASMQPVEAVWESDPPAWRAPLSRLLERPDVASAFAKIGRILPKAYWPKPGPHLSGAAR